MKRILIALIVAAFLSTSAFTQTTRVKGHTKKDGTYVAPHRRTSPNKTKDDNWSIKGNVNPDTGKKGTKKPR